MAEFNTVEKILKYVKPLIDKYRKHPLHMKDEVIEELRLVFSIDFECWSIVIQENKFLESFRKPMAKKRMRPLRELLLKIDPDFYEKVDFGLN